MTKSSLSLVAAFTFLVAAPVSAQEGFSSCLAQVRGQALAKGVSGSTFDSALSGVQPDMKIIELMNNQPEFKTPIWDYLAVLVDEEKVAQGREMLARHASVLARAEQQYGVDRHAIVAVWGVESDFGQISGRWPLVQALSTVSCFGRRQTYFRGELISTLRIIQRGDLPQSKLVGSWAGAFGHTQFMPSTYLSTAVDFDGDGRRDLVDSIPDVVASTANYLKKAGWQSGASWGYEVEVPSGYSGPSGRRNKQSLASFSSRGIRKIDGSALTGGGQAALLMPAGANGPAFITFKNFDAAYAYNAAESYALAISVLSDRLKGRPGIRTPWPTDDPGISRAERKELQRLLIARGYDVGAPDGAVGALTRAAIRDVEAKLGMAPTGRPGRRVLQALRGR